MRIIIFFIIMLKTDIFLNTYRTNIREKVNKEKIVRRFEYFWSRPSKMYEFTGKSKSKSQDTKIF